MDFRLLAAVLAIYQILMAPLPVLAGERWPLFTASEKRAYHDCLYASFINDYCRFHAWGASEAAVRECVIANAAGRIPFGFPYWNFGTYESCRALVQRSRF